MGSTDGKLYASLSPGISGMKARLGELHDNSEETGTDEKPFLLEEDERWLIIDEIKLEKSSRHAAG